MAIDSCATDDGRKGLAQAFPVVTRAVREYFTQHLSEEEAVAVARILGGVPGLRQGRLPCH
jgi:hypothetical protein